MGPYVHFLHSLRASVRLIPAHHVPLFVAFSLVSVSCVSLGLSHCMSLCCPALRIHNHTVLPSSHNSSYVYTNDSAFTNISATVGEHPSLLHHPPLASIVISLCLFSGVRIVMCDACLDYLYCRPT